MSRSKIFLEISVCAVMLAVLVAAYNRSRWATGFPSAFPPPPHGQRFQPDNIPPPEPVEPEPPGDTRSWGERFRSPEIPDIPSIEWQIYTNTEYGFTMEYPAGWNIAISKNQDPEVTVFQFFVGKPVIGEGDQVLIVEMRKGVLPKELIWMDPEWAERINTLGLIPDAAFNGRYVFIRHPERNSQQMELFLAFEKDGFVYKFFESNRKYKDVIERMIKTFRFLE